MEIAGHTFTNGRCSCGVLWADIRGADDTCVGKQGWAHVANLTAEELRQIQAAREAEGTRFAEVTAGVSGRK